MYAIVTRWGDVYGIRISEYPNAVVLVWASVGNSLCICSGVIRDLRERGCKNPIMVGASARLSNGQYEQTGADAFFTDPFSAAKTIQKLSARVR